MQLVTLREYARRKDVSLTAVQKGVKTGRIVAQTDAETGKITGIDWDTQADAWEANSRGNFKPHTLAGGRPRNDGQPPAKPAKAQAQAEPQQQPAEKGPMSLADIQRARELVKLQIDSLKLKEAQGELVSAAEQERLGADLGAKVVASLYNIPERISDDLAGMTSPHDIHKLLLAEIDMAVEGLRRAYGA